ncbi:MerR family DNA-binding transcriptional regulator [Magnetospirillum fulvum]
MKRVSMTIGELAKRSGLSAHTIRSYERTRSPFYPRPG